MKAALANSAWLAGCLPALARFRRATKRVAETQSSILRRTLAANQDTEFGREHRFGSVTTVADYQSLVPLCDYESCSPDILRIAAGERNVLTSEPVRLFEPTSGSSGAQKWVPYNRALQREFQAGIRAWIADLFLHEPGVLGGEAYWSVSPALTVQRKTAGGIPIGFEEDADYVGAWQKGLVNSLMAVPSEVRKIRDVDAFRYVTLLFLLRNRNLRLISVWNPAFLTMLLAPLQNCADTLIADLKLGTISVQSEIPQILRHKFVADPWRAEEVRSALKAADPAAIHQQLWPRLCVVSCWSDANSEAAAKALAGLFPQAWLQAKGLLATEGFVSFPLHGHQGSALAISSHFLEFLPVNEAGHRDFERPQLAHELDLGQRYAVVLTTGGGLYRYQLQDVVEVMTRLGDCPTIRFVGRLGCVSDWFGEKLNEVHVAGILRDVFNRVGISPAFAMVACDPDSSKPGYTLFIESQTTLETLHQARLAVEERLRDNFHYNYARNLGQLAELRVFRTSDGAETYLKSKMANGQRGGDIKPTALDRGGQWSRIFRGEFLGEAVQHSAAHGVISDWNVPLLSYHS
ncbi:MAG: GH3 auxin-responsive promoter [Acidobacteria bacterium]|nr:MAG: GH3 auxin-responsive promoter [Acidobacteriota bacterium]